MKQQSLSVWMLTFVLTAAVTLMHASHLQADVNDGYVLGPYYSYGYGSEAQASAEAYDNMLDMIDDIAAQLGPGESIQGFVITYEDYDPTIQEYVITFDVYISSQGPPGM